MKGDDPKGIGDILEGLKQSTDLGRQLEYATIWKHWAEIAGDPLFMHGQPRGGRDGCLYVEVESPVWMHRYAYAKWDIIRRISTIHKKDLVSDLFERASGDACPFGGGICGVGEKCPLHDKFARVRAASEKILHDTTFGVFRRKRSNKR